MFNTTTAAKFLAVRNDAIAMEFAKIAPVFLMLCSELSCTGLICRPVTASNNWPQTPRGPRSLD